MAETSTSLKVTSGAAPAIPNWSADGDDFVSRAELNAIGAGVVGLADGRVVRDKDTLVATDDAAESVAVTADSTGKLSVVPSKTGAVGSVLTTVAEAEAAVLVARIERERGRVLMHQAGVLQAPVQLDPNAVLGLGQFPGDTKVSDYYDVEQSYLKNRVPVAQREAMGAVYGTTYGAIFDDDKYGDYVWWDQTIGGATSEIKVTIPSLTSPTVFTVEGRYSDEPNGFWRRVWYIAATGPDPLMQMSPAGVLRVVDGTTAFDTASTVGTLLSQAEHLPFYHQASFNGTTLDVDISVDGITWVDAIDATITAVVADGTLSLGSWSGASSGGRGRYYDLKLRDGLATAPIVARLDPATMFRPGSRVNGSTSVDEQGNTWSLEKPTATMPAIEHSLGLKRKFSMPGVSGNSFSTPDTPGNSITGDIDIRCKFVSNGAPAASEVLIDKYFNAAGRRSFQLGLTSSSLVTLLWSEDGEATVGGLYYSSVGLQTVAPAGTTVILRAYLDVDDGSGNYVLVFEYSLEDVEPEDVITWLPLGVTRTTVGTTSIFDSAEPIHIGGLNNGTTNMFAGGLMWAEIRDGINGPVVVSHDVRDAVVGSNTWVSSKTGETWTTNRSTTGAPILLVDRMLLPLDGVTGWRVPHHPDLDIVASDGFSVAVGAVVNSHTGNNAFLIAKVDSSSFGWAIRRASSNATFYLWMHDGTLQASAGAAVSPNITYGNPFVIAGAAATSDQAGYMDGVSLQSTALAITAISEPAEDLRIGESSAGAIVAQSAISSFTVIKARRSDTAVAELSRELVS